MFIRDLRVEKSWLNYRRSDSNRGFPCHRGSNFPNLTLKFFLGYFFFFLHLLSSIFQELFFTDFLLPKCQKHPIRHIDGLKCRLLFDTRYLKASKLAKNSHFVAVLQFRSHYHLGSRAYSIKT